MLSLLAVKGGLTNHGIVIFLIHQAIEVCFIIDLDLENPVIHRILSGNGCEVFEHSRIHVGDFSACRAVDFRGSLYRFKNSCCCAFIDRRTNFRKLDKNYISKLLDGMW